MYCTNCGKQISDDSRFCTYCGNPLASAAGGAKEKYHPDVNPVKRHRDTSLYSDSEVHSGSGTLSDRKTNVYRWMLNASFYFFILYSIALFVAYSSYNVQLEQQEAGTLKGYPLIHVDVTVKDKMSNGALSLGIMHAFSEYDVTSMLMGGKSSFTPQYTEAAVNEFVAKTVDRYKRQNLAWLGVFMALSAACYLLKRYLIKQGII